MKQLKRTALIFLCINSFLITEFTLAQNPNPNSYTEPTTTKVSRIGLVFWGSVLTFISRKKSDIVFFIGWGMMISGFISSSTQLVRNLVLIDNTELDMYAGRESPENFQGKILAGPFLEKIEMDALTAVYSSKLAQHLPMVEVLNKFHMDPQRVGQLILNAKVLGDAALNGKEFGDRITLVDSSKIKPDFDGQLSPSERNIIKNYLRLRNIIITKKRSSG